jgi:ribosome-binding ATPase
MGFSCGLIGLPNVGKSTLFNVLTKTFCAESSNYPFTTINPNLGFVSVYDNRLDKLFSIAGSIDKISTSIKLVDIAGLVRGASKGEGLGNQFLENIRNVDAIIHVLRCFDDKNISHVERSVDPLRDLEIVEMELILSDIDLLEREITRLNKFNTNGTESAKLKNLYEHLLSFLYKNKPVRFLELNADELYALKKVNLLTIKPVIYVLNVSEDDYLNGNSYTTKINNFVENNGDKCLMISIYLEELISLSDKDEKEKYLSSIGVKNTNLSKVVTYGYDMLDLITFFTVGEKESRAWTIKRSTKAADAASVIHTDFKRGFISLKVISYDDYLYHNGEIGAKTAGKLRSEGKDYVLNDGDICHFLFNV